MLLALLAKVLGSLLPVPSAKIAKELGAVKLASGVRIVEALVNLVGKVISVLIAKELELITLMMCMRITRDPVYPTVQELIALLVKEPELIKMAMHVRIAEELVNLVSREPFALLAKELEQAVLVMCARIAEALVDSMGRILFALLAKEPGSIAVPANQPISVDVAPAAAVTGAVAPIDTQALARLTCQTTKESRCALSGWGDLPSFGAGRITTRLNKIERDSNNNSNKIKTKTTEGRRR